MGIVWQHTRLPLVGAALFVGFGAITDAADICVGSGSQGSGLTPVFNFSNFASTTNLHLAGNFSAFVGNTLYPLIQNQGHADGSCWYGTQVSTGSFTTVFTCQFLLPLSVPQQIGAVWCIQNSTAPPGTSGFTGLSAIADSNTNGYGTFVANTQNLNASVGIKLEMSPLGNAYPIAGAPASTGLYMNGGPLNEMLPQEDLNPNGINLYTGNLLQVTIVYDAALSLFTAVILDTVAGTQARKVWPVNVANEVGSLGYVGFTAGGVSNEGFAVQSWAHWNGFNSRLATPVISPTAGQYSGSQTVSISGSGSIYYTTNGLLPTSSDTLYTAPFTVSANAIVQAVAINSGNTDSLVATNAYQIGTANHISLSSFAANDGMILCGSAVLSSGKIQLVNTTGFPAGSNPTVMAGAAWWGAPVPISSGFTLNCQVQFASANANGMCIVFQNYLPAASDNATAPAWKTNGPFVTASPQSGLGYGGSVVNSAGASLGIPNSVAVALDIFDSNVIGVYTGGATPAGSSASSGLTFNGTFNISLIYSGTTLAMTMQSTGGGALFSHNFTVDIPGNVGSGSAYVGFTAGTGGQTANIFINSLTCT